MTEFDKTVSRILEIPKFTTKNEPAHTREFMRRLGNPQEDFLAVHVAGSNGKGSVCAFLNSVLMESKISVGMFTSPHLTDLRERFLIQGKMCSREWFLEAEAKVRRTVETMREDGLPHPTFFEYIFGIGMILFSEARITCGILETGLGGRLDATNVIEHPVLTILTSISLEHTEILGDTIEAIATEKAGIIKPRTPVIFDGNQRAAAAVIRRAAEQNDAPFEEITMDKINIIRNDGKMIDFYLDCRYDVKRVRIPFPAEYQASNAALALAAAGRLSECLPIAGNDVLRGFRNARWPGRMEELIPEVYLDGAHNVSGIEAFLQAVHTMAQEPSILLFSMVKEKNYQESIRLLCRQGNWELIILTRISDNPRGLGIDCLEEQFVRESGDKCSILLAENPKKALAEAISRKRPGQKIFVTGSLYLIGELKKEVSADD